MASASDLNQLYLAYFGRPADAGGLAFYANASLADVFATFAASAESTALYGSGPFGAAQITQVYTTLFNRAPEAAGLAAWQAQLAAGTTNPAALALAILQGAQNDDKATVANKLVFTAQWTATFEAQAEQAGASSASSYALARSLMAGVGATATSLDNIIAAAPSAITSATAPAASAPAPAPTPQTFTLTTGADTIAGGAADDTINGIANYNSAAEQPASTLNAATDTIDGGAGTDTLVLSTSGTTPAITLSPTRITNVEKLQLNASVTGTTITLAATSSFTELVDNGGIAAKLQGFGANVTRLGVTSISGPGNSASFNPDGSTLTGNSDAVTLTLTDAGTSSNTAIINLAPQSGTAYYETLNIVSAGTASYVTLATGTTQTSLATINISGSTPLTLLPTSGDKVATTATFDASASTGGLVLGGTNNPLGAANQTIKLGSGDDTVYFGANLDSGDTVDGGAGRDTLVIATSSGTGITTTAPTLNPLTNVSNVEVLRLDVSSANIFAQDFSQFAGHGLTDIAIARISPGGTTTTTLSHLPSDNSVAVDLLSSMGSSNTTLTLGLLNSGAGSSDALTLRFANLGSGNIAITSMAAIAGLETLNIDSGGGAPTNSITSDAISAQQVLTGGVAFTVTAATSVAMKFDASAFTGKLTISGASSGTANDTVVLGSGADKVDMKTGTDTITLGAQGHNAVAGADTIASAGTTTTVRFVGNIAAGNGQVVGYGTAAMGAALIGSTSTGTGLPTGLTVAFSADDNDFSLANAAGTASTGLAKGSLAKGLTAGVPLVAQTLAQNVVAATAVTDVTLIKLITSVNPGSNTAAKAVFQAAIGTSSITGLAADANYLVELYDSSTGVQRTVFAVVNTGASGAGDTTLSAADFTDTGMAVIIGVAGGNSGSLNSGITSFGAAF